MKVRQEHVPDLDPQPPCVVQVLIDVALGIDDRGLPALLVRHEIGRVGEAPEVVLPEDHVGCGTMRM